MTWEKQTALKSSQLNIDTYRQRTYNGTNSNVNHYMGLPVLWDKVVYKYKCSSYDKSCIHEESWKKKN
jgi:hypothetical protein